MASPQGGQAQAEYFVAVLTARRDELETEIAERCAELTTLPDSARHSERARNIRRLITGKRTEVCELQRLCAALTERITP